MATVKKVYAIYYERDGLKHYFQYNIKNGPKVLCLNVKDAMKFTLKEANTEIKARGKSWQKELVDH